MNLFTRMKETISADFHELLDKKEQKNPIGMLNQYLRQCEQETEKVRKLVERQALLKTQFLQEYKEATLMVEKRTHQAEVAKQAGEIELAEFAEQETAQYQARATHLKAALEQAEEQQTTLERKYEEMKHKLKDMHIRRMELMGRENIARANHRMNQVLDADKPYSQSIAKFEDMEFYLDRIEQQVNSNYHRHTIDARIAKLEKESKSNSLS